MARFVLFLLTALFTAGFTLLVGMAGESSFLILSLALCGSILISQVPSLKKPSFSLILGYSTGLLGAYLVPLRSLELSAPKSLVLVAIAGLFFVLFACFIKVLSSGAKGSGYMLLAILMCCALAALSGDAGGADPMLKLFRKLGLNPQMAEIAVIIFRKSVHIGFYGVLAVLSFRASGLQWFAIAFPMLHALFDESRQAFAAHNRSGSIMDVAIDAFGVALFLFLIGAFKKKDLKPLETN